MKCIIVGYDRNRAIGAQGALPWAGHMKKDMARVREVTTGNAIIMGRKTYQSIGRALPNRQNIVISRTPQNIEGVTCVTSLDDAYETVEEGKDAYIFGGEQIYQLALNDGQVDRIYATEIEVAVANADAYFPAVEPAEWIEVSREHFERDEHNTYSFSFVTLDKAQ